MALRSNSATTIARRSAGLASATNARASSSVIGLCPRTLRARPDSPDSTTGSTVPPARRGQVSPATGPRLVAPRRRRLLVSLALGEVALGAGRGPGGERRAKGGVGGGGLVAPFERDDGLGLQPFTSRTIFPRLAARRKIMDQCFSDEISREVDGADGQFSPAQRLDIPCSWRQGAASALSQHLSQTARVDIENEAPHRNVFRNPGMRPDHLDLVLGLLLRILEGKEAHRGGCCVSSQLGEFGV